MTAAKVLFLTNYQAFTYFYYAAIHLRSRTVSIDTIVPLSYKS
jgi:hypothetical protein